VSTKLLIFADARSIIEANFKPAFLGEEVTVLLEAHNRVLSQDVVSPIDIPPFNTSKVNGYAVHAKDTVIANEDEPFRLKVTAVAGIGEQPQVALAVGEAVEVRVGSALPDGADTIIATKDATREDNTLMVYSSVSKGENVDVTGSDIQKGRVVLKKGQVLGPQEIGILAALGSTQVKVLKIPLIAVLSVDSDVAELGKNLIPKKTFDASAYSLCIAAVECGAKPVYFGTAPSSKTEFDHILATAVASSDLVIVCGGDTTEIVNSLSTMDLVVNGVATKPGKQTAVAFINQKPLFFLPNNPSAALLMYQLLVRPLVQQLSGRPPFALKAMTAYAGSKMFSAKGSRTFALVTLSFDANCRLIADVVESAGAVGALAEADGFVEIAENAPFVDVNQEVTVMLLRGLAGRP